MSDNVEFDISTLLTLPIKEANVLMGKRASRIVREDGVDFMVTCDYEPERINLCLEKGKVVNAYLG